MSFSFRSLFQVGDAFGQPEETTSATIQVSQEPAPTPPQASPIKVASPFGSPMFKSASGESVAPTSPFAAASQPSFSSSLTVGDLLPQLPPEVSRSGVLPLEQPVAISSQVLDEALRRGMYTIPLFEVYRVCPALFSTPISPQDPRLVPLPASKLPRLCAAAQSRGKENLPSDSPFCTPAASPAASPFAPPPVPTAPLFGNATEAFLDNKNSLPALGSPSDLLPPRRQGEPPPLPDILNLLKREGSTTTAFPASPFATTPTSPLDSMPSAVPLPFFCAPPPFVAVPSPSLVVPPASPFGVARVSFASLVKAYTSAELGFDPMVVPAWITTAIPTQSIREWSEMVEPMAHLGFLIDNITDVGFRNVLNTAQRNFQVQIELGLLHSVLASNPTSPDQACLDLPSLAPPPALASHILPTIGDIVRISPSTGFDLEQDTTSLRTPSPKVEVRNLEAYLKQLATGQIEAQGFSSSEYVLTVERRGGLPAPRGFVPRRLDLGTQTEQELRDGSESPTPQFLFAIRDLAQKAVRICNLEDDVEYAHQITLFWAQIGELKNFISISPIVAEIVAELRTARYQMLKRDTPPEFIQTVAMGLQLIASSSRLDADLVDAMVEIMAHGGFDSLAPAPITDTDERRFP